jgi:hypothetical protein
VGDPRRAGQPIHWQDGRSAKELAKAWVDGSGPAALVQLLGRARSTADLRIVKATAEAQTAFDAFPGGRRNHDLLVEAQAAGGPTIIGLEGKADESFGQTLDSFGRAATAKADRGHPTNAWQRLDNLVGDLAGTTLEARPELRKLRYQLFSGVAGTLAAAKPAGQAAFVVHEFNTSKTTKAKRSANAAAIAAFVEHLFGTNVPTGEEWWLVGPFSVPARRWSGIPLWIGHLTTCPEAQTSA